MKWDQPVITDYGTIVELTHSMDIGGPEDCGGKHGTEALHTSPTGPACPKYH